jgi:hypothetical protein
VPGLTNVQQIGAGGRHSCALLRDGSAWCWGENESGQLGDGTHAARTLPTRVVAPGITFVSLAVGANHTCAVASDGRGFCWGLDDQCQLADPNTSAAHDAPAPLSLMHVHAMAAGGFDTCAITDDGLARCWGSNAEGEDGDCLGTSPRCGSVDRETVMSGMPPAPASAPFPNLQRISMGTFHACGLDTNGTVFCWGSGVHGQLAEQPGMFGPLVRGACPEPMGFGNGYYAPLAVPMLPAAIDVAASTFDSCAVLRDGTVRCWGGNTYGQLATCDPGDHIVPLTVAGIMGAEQVALGAAHACVRIQQRAVYCWGDNEDGRLGDGTTVSRATPEPVEW